MRQQRARSYACVPFEQPVSHPMARDETLVDTAATRPRLLRRLLAASSLVVVISAVAYQTIPASRLSATPLDTVTSRIVFTLQWNAPTVAVIFFMVVFIGNIRFSTNQQNPLATADLDKVEVC